MVGGTQDPKPQPLGALPAEQPAQTTSDDVRRRYRLDPGDVDRLQERAGQFASGVVAFCAGIGYDLIAGHLSAFVVRPPPPFSGAGVANIFWLQASR